MRIIAGRHGGRRLAAPRSLLTRPTADRVKEALFSILPDLEGARVLDLYSGTGALALEAISRGASSAVCVESARRAAAIILENAESLCETERVRLVTDSVEKTIGRIEGPFDLIVADPPWDLAAKAAPMIFDAASRILATTGLLVIEHGFRAPLPDPPAAFERKDLRRYGDTALAFFTLR
ncbi:MAG: 16S rRNA (guanine(966)-N(2))-methyltransferase RsmD [Deltaproteobacteria bacterium]|nr:16S rRNA (guanine(966)-N(2))-methyltransferase RsmD [Deltaproteobacteria bacterium]